MAEKKLYIGGHGPFLYDDDANVDDPDGDFAGETQDGFQTDGQVYVGTAPTKNEHVARLADIGAGVIEVQVFS